MPRFICIFVLSAAVLLAGASPSTPAGPTVTDSLYAANHPCILFTTAELPALRAKVADGGYDDDAYAFLRFIAETYYPQLEPDSLLAGEWGLNAIPNLGVAAFLETPIDTTAIRVGRNATAHIAGSYGVDDGPWGSGLRLRALTLGYDMFFADAPESTRTFVRNEIADYMDYMTSSFIYNLYSYRPYLSNKTAMFVSSLGMAAICLQEEADPQLLYDSMFMADRLIDSLLAYQFDPGGAYKEGCLYGAWSLRQLIPYFHARKRFDGYNYANRPQIRNAEQWFAYELLPEAGGKSNNLNDSQYDSTPLAWHTTYFDWAQSEWDSGLAAWLWEHIAGPFGADSGIVADKTSTVLWNRTLPPVQPNSILPDHKLWLDRGLYYYRDGWQGGTNAEDVMLSLYSGKFHGGHAQEDQNQFTLFAYGAKFAIDHGPGSYARNTGSHNLVLIDGAGQHIACCSVGTDGRIAGHLLSNFADYIQGDATAAYTTYSEFNAPGYPFPGSDWSWGYAQANPVNFALRHVIVVHGDGAPPYFVIVDDIEKDGTTHDYQWRMHTLDLNTVDTGVNPIRIEAPTAAMDVHVLYPDFASLGLSTQPYDNGVADPNSILLELSHNAINPRFSLLLFPSNSSVIPPVVDREIHPWGFACRLDWGGGVADVVLGNYSGGTIFWGQDSLVTDATFAVIRSYGSTVLRHLLIDGSVLQFGGTEYVRFFNAPATCALSGDVVEIDQEDAVFSFLDAGINQVMFRGSDVPFVRRSGNVISPPAIEHYSLGCTPDVFVPGPMLEYELGGFDISSDFDKDRAFHYWLTTDGPCALDDQEPLSLGGVVTIAPGQTFAPPPAKLMIPGHPVQWFVQEIVYHVQLVGDTTSIDSCATGILYEISVPTVFRQVYAGIDDGVVVLKWTVGDAEDLLGFNVYRSIGNQNNFVRLNEVLIARNVAEFVDEHPEPGRRYAYRIGAVEESGEFLSPVTVVDLPQRDVTLFQNRPNPFNPSTTISYYLPRRSYVRLDIYDLQGKLVRRLVDGVQPSKMHSVLWSGKNSSGNTVSSGVYYFRLVAGETVLTRKLVFLK
jgi:hypothetical protein